jgi:putative transposase
MTDKKDTKEIVHAIPQALLDHVVANYKKPADLIGENGLLKQLTKAVIEAALNAEMGQHLGHDRHALAGNATGNVRNGYSAKTITGDFGNIELAVQRDRTASFTPQLIPKHQRRFRRL